jgi:hypothetical protein
MHTILHASSIIEHSVGITVYYLEHSVLMHRHIGMAHHRIFIGLEVRRCMCELHPSHLITHADL